MLHHHPSLPSTQDQAHQLAADGAPHGTAVVARVQTAGRGTRGRTWVSPEGGLWLSVICRPDPRSGIEAVTVRVGLALADYLDGLIPRPASHPPSPGSSLLLKWPNDLMLGEGKVGGILAEAKWQGERLGWIVVGVGLNLHNPLPEETDPPAVRLADAGVAATPEQLAGPIAALVARAARIGAPLSELELAAFAARDWLKRGVPRAPKSRLGRRRGED